MSAGGDESLTYEQLVESLEELTRLMADGSIGIEEVVGLYERAGHLHDLAAQRLAAVQARIEALSGEQAAAPGRQVAAPDGPEDQPED